MLTRESYVKHNSRMLVQGNVGRVKKLGVVIGKSGRGSNITYILSQVINFLCNYTGGELIYRVLYMDNLLR